MTSSTTTSEWGVPEHDDRRLFEFLILEGAQAGLSWLTILRKRDGYRRAFAGFDPEKVARFSASDARRLLGDAGIVRQRAKIEAAIGNARACLAVQRECGSLANYVWGFVGGRPIQNAWRSLGEVPSDDGCLESAEPRSEAARLPLRRPDHLLRVHAVGRNGQRPRRRLLPVGCRAPAGRADHAAQPTHLEARRRMIRTGPPNSLQAPPLSIS